MSCRTGTGRPPLYMLARIAGPRHRSPITNHSYNNNWGVGALAGRRGRPRARPSHAGRRRRRVATRRPHQVGRQAIIISGVPIRRLLRQPLPPGSHHLPGGRTGRAGRGRAGRGPGRVITILYVSLIALMTNIINHLNNQYI